MKPLNYEETLKEASKLLERLGPDLTEAFTKKAMWVWSSGLTFGAFEEKDEAVVHWNHLPNERKLCLIYWAFSLDAGFQQGLKGNSDNANELLDQLRNVPNTSITIYPAFTDGGVPATYTISVLAQCHAYTVRHYSGQLSEAVKEALRDIQQATAQKI